MIYKSSVLTATFFLLPILVPNSQVMAAEVPMSKDSADLPSGALTQPLPRIVTDGVPKHDTELLDVRVSVPSSPVSNTPKIDRLGYVSTLSEVVPVVQSKLAQGNSSSTSAAPKQWGIGIHAQASTTGFIGVDGGYKFSPNLHARLGLNTVGFNINYNSEGIDYSSSFKPTNIHLLGDYFPFGGGLRLTGGLVAQNNQFTAKSKADSSNQININGTNYAASEIGTIEGEGKFSSSIAPYLGIGFGTPISEGFGFNIDAGVLFAGSPTVKLRANNVSASVPAVVQAQLQSDLAEQERKTNEDIKGFNIYPAISIGFSYGF